MGPITFNLDLDIGRREFEMLQQMVEQRFSTFRPGQRRYICNVVSNKIRRAEFDIYIVEVSPHPFKAAEGYFSFDSFAVGDARAYIRFTVD